MTAITTKPGTATGPGRAPRPGLARRLYAGWLEVAARFGEVQTVLIVCLVYTLVIGPIALGAMAARRDLLSKRGFAAGTSAWSQAETVSSPDVQRAQRWF